jgi:RNA polymerase sigma-70 factor (ECF subfamily)
MGLSVHFSEDIVQEVYVKVLKGQDRFRGDSTVRTWVNRIIHNECFNERKRETREAKWIEPAEPEHDPPESESSSDDLILKLQVAAAKEFIRAQYPGLPMKILAALESEGPLSTRELADLLGMRKSTIHEALKKLRPVFGGMITFPAARQKVKKTSSSGSG